MNYKAPIIIFIIYAIIFLPIIIGCNANIADQDNFRDEITTEQKQKIVETVVFHIEKDYLPDDQMLNKLINNFNNILKEHNIPAIIKIDAQPRETGVTILAGVDVFRVHGLNDYVSLIENGKIVDITNEMSKRKSLYDINPPYVWNEVKHGGSVYGFPLMSNQRSVNGIADTSFLIRRDVLEQLDIETPSTWDDLIALSEIARNENLDYKIVYPYSYPPYALHRTYDTWPFFVNFDSTALYDINNNVASYLESDIYINDAKLMSYAYEKGLLQPIKTNEVEAFKLKGETFLASMFPANSLYRDSANYANVGFVQFMPDKPSFPLYNAYHSILCIPAPISEHRLSIIMDVIQSIYTDIWVYSAFVYGIENTDFRIIDENTFEIISPGFMPLYNHGKVTLKLKTGMPYFNLDPEKSGIIEFYAPFFSFNKPDQTFDNVFRELYKPGGLIAIRLGLADMKTYDTNLKTLKFMGLGKLIDEMNVQYDDYLSRLSEESFTK